MRGFKCAVAVLPVALGICCVQTLGVLAGGPRTLRVETPRFAAIPSAQRLHTHKQLSRLWGGLASEKHCRLAVEPGAGSPRASIDREAQLGLRPWKKAAAGGTLGAAAALEPLRLKDSALKGEGSTAAQRGNTGARGLPSTLAGRPSWPLEAGGGLRRFALAGDGGGAGAEGLCEACLAGDVACGGSVSGELSTTDCPFVEGFFVDIWRVELATAQELSAHLRSDAFDAFLFLIAADCRALGSNNDCPEQGPDSCLNVPLSPGVYFLGASSADPGGSGPYVLDVACGEAALCRDCVVSTLACEETAVGSLDPDDCILDDDTPIDLFCLELPKQSRVTVTLESTAFDAFLWLYDGSCFALSSDDDGGGDTDSRLVADLPAGTYFLGANSFDPDAEGAYELRASCQVGFDFCTQCRAGPVRCHETRSGELRPDDCSLALDGTSVDLYSFELPDPGPVVIDLRSQAFDAFVYLYDAGCGVLATNDDGGEGLNSRLVLNLDAGSYVIGASSFAAGAEGAYELEVACPDSRLCADCRAGALTCGVALNAELPAGDCQDEVGRALDVHEFSLEVASVVSLRVHSEAFSPALDLRDGFCRLMESAAACADAPGACIGERVLLGGDYSAVVREDAAGAAGPYDVVLECRDFNPCADCLAGAIACGQSASGELNARDCPFSDGSYFDVYRFDLARGQEVQLTLRSPDFNPFLLLIDAACLVVATNDDCDPATLDACITIDLPPGSYFVVANTLSAGKTGAYTLEVACRDNRLCADCEVGVLSCGETASGGLTSSSCTLADGSSIDLYRLEVPTPTAVRLSLSSQEFDAFLYLFDGTCVLLGTNDDCNTATLDACIERELAAGTYYAGVNSFRPAQSGAYRLAMECPGLDLCEACRVGPLEIGATRSGTLPEGQCRRPGGARLDVLSLELAEAAELAIHLDSEEFDPVLLVLDAGCVEIASNDDCDAATLGSCLEVRLEAGRYSIGVSSAFAGEGGTYRLEITSVVRVEGQVPGDCDQDTRVTLADALCLLNFLFVGEDPKFLPCGGGLGDEPANLSLMDHNGDVALDTADAVALLEAVFRGGRPHVQGGACIPISGCPAVCAQ